MSDDLLRRLEAVERAVSDGQTDLTAVSDAAATDEQLARIEARVDDLEAELASLDASLQAIRGYLGGIEGVSEDVERRADLALAKATTLEAMVSDERDGLVVERLPAVEDAHTARRIDGDDPDDIGVDGADSDTSDTSADSDTGWAAQAATRFSAPTEPASLLERDTVGDGSSAGSHAPPRSDAQSGLDAGSATDAERAGGDDGVDGSFVDQLRNALGQ